MILNHSAIGQRIFTKTLVVRERQLTEMCHKRKESNLFEKDALALRGRTKAGQEVSEQYFLSETYAIVGPL
jgi:hypothetical protein